MLAPLQALNPGNLTTDLARHVSALQAVFIRMITYPPVNGAYTELFAGLSPDVAASLKQNEWVIPFGRITALRKDLALAGLGEGEGGTGNARRFWEWSEEQVRQYV